MQAVLRDVNRAWRADAGSKIVTGGAAAGNLKFLVQGLLEMAVLVEPCDEFLYPLLLAVVRGVGVGLFAPRFVFGVVDRA